MGVTGAVTVIIVAVILLKIANVVAMVAAVVAAFIIWQAFIQMKELKDYEQEKIETMENQKW